MKRCLLALLAVSILITAGCLSGPTTNPVSATPVVSTPTSQDPIVGTWHWTLFDHSKTLFYTFNADGRYVASDSITTDTKSGTWVKTSVNNYTVTVGYIKTLFEYLPTSNTIAMADSPTLQFYPEGAGPAIVTPDAGQTMQPGQDVTQQPASIADSSNPVNIVLNLINDILNSTNQTAQQIYHPAILNKK